MNTKTLYAKFNQALFWNGVFYAISRIAKTATTIVLFNQMNPQDFSAWATIFGIVFSAVLFFDFGFRVSVPRYLPEFAFHAPTKRFFLYGILLLRAIIIGVSSFLLIMHASYITALFNIPKYYHFFILGCLLYIGESFASTVQSLFHAQFWVKQYTLIQTVALVFSTSIVLYTSMNAHSSRFIMYSIFYTAIGRSWATVIISLFIIRKLNSDTDYQQQHTISPHKIAKEFVTHSAVMWAMMILASITERNVVLPFLSLVTTQTNVALFKVANDMALLIQRFIFKVINSSSIAMLSHFESGLVTMASWKKASEHIHTKILTIISVVSGCIFFIWLNAQIPLTMYRYVIRLALPYNQSNQVTNIFLFLTVLYAVHLLFIVYERLLEVKRNYFVLCISYIPSILLVSTYLVRYPQNISLIQVLTIIGILKSTTLGIKVLFARKKYNISFPTRMMCSRLILSMGVALSCYTILTYLELLIIKFAQIIIQ